MSKDDECLMELETGYWYEFIQVTDERKRFRIVGMSSDAKPILEYRNGQCYRVESNRFPFRWLEGCDSWDWIEPTEEPEETSGEMLLFKVRSQSSSGLWVMYCGTKEELEEHKRVSANETVSLTTEHLITQLEEPSTKPSVNQGIDECPVDGCGAGLLAKQTDLHEMVVLDEFGSLIDSYETNRDSTCVISCSNGHSHSEIAVALSDAQNQSE